MAHKVYDGKGRWRNKFVTFRASPEESEQLDVAVALSGLSKQDYIIRRLQERDVVVVGNPRVHKALRNQMTTVLEQLKRITVGNPVDPELLDVIRLITTTMDGLKEEQNDRQ